MKNASVRENRAGPATDTFGHSNNAVLSRKAQLARVLYYLHQHHLLRSADRVLELQERLHRVERSWREEHDAAANPHRVVEYTLAPTVAGEVAT